MSQALPDLVQVALSGRYAKSFLGIVPRPRPLMRAPAGLDPEKLSSLNYERLVRCLSRQKPLRWPFYPHSLIELERHLLRLGALEQGFETQFGLRLLSQQADGYVAAWRHGKFNMRPEMKLAAAAFVEIYKISVARLSDECPKCDALVKKRLALSGFVS